MRLLGLILSLPGQGAHTGGPIVMGARIRMLSACLGIGLSSDGGPEGKANCPEVGHKCGAQQVPRGNTSDVDPDDLQRPIAHDVQDCVYASKVQRLRAIGHCTGVSSVRESCHLNTDRRGTLSAAPPKCL